jgi:hypothetical protein
MKSHISLAVTMTAIAVALSACTVGANPPSIDTGVGTNAPTGAPAETPTPTPTETETTSPDAVSTPLPTGPTGTGAAPAHEGLPGEPIPASELAGSRTAKHMRFVASRLDAYVKANGVPADWATQTGAANVEAAPGTGGDCWTYISILSTPEESAAWDDGIQTTYQCFPDGSYTLSGWGEGGADPKYRDFNTSLDYESGKGFVRN